MTIKRILVPTDFSEPSLKALDYAIDFTRAHNAELLLLHVVEPIRHTRMVPDVAAILEHHRAEAAEKIAELHCAANEAPGRGDATHNRRRRRPAAQA